MTIVFFIVGLSVILSYDWKSGGFLDTAPVTILFGILVGGIIYVAARYGRRGPSYFFAATTCPYCRRIIPVDSNLCPYCGQRLR